MTPEHIIEAIIEREGGYVDHPADRGGPTKYGITLATLRSWLNAQATADDVEALTKAQAAAIYQKRYVIDPGLDAIVNDRLRGLVVDTYVMQTPKTAFSMLQRACGVAVDGVFGTKTLAACNANPEWVYDGLCAERVMFRGRHVAANPDQLVFLSGWLNRDAEFIRA